MSTGPLLVGMGVAAVFLLSKFRSAGATPAQPPTLDARIKRQVEQWRAVAERQSSGVRSVTVPLVLAVIARETGGIARRGLDGERGLMQITEEAWADYFAATNDPDATTFDTMDSPDINIRAGSWLLGQRIQAMRGDRYEGLRAYNCGVTGALRNPTCGGTYADWVLTVGEPAFRKGIA